MVKTKKKTHGKTKKKVYAETKKKVYAEIKKKAYVGTKKKAYVERKKKTLGKKTNIYRFKKKSRGGVNGLLYETEAPAPQNYSKRTLRWAKNKDRDELWDSLTEGLNESDPNYYSEVQDRKNVYYNYDFENQFGYNLRHDDDQEEGNDDDDNYEDRFRQLLEWGLNKSQDKLWNTLEDGLDPNDPFYDNIYQNRINYASNNGPPETYDLDVADYNYTPDHDDSGGLTYRSAWHRQFIGDHNNIHALGGTPDDPTLFQVSFDSYEQFNNYINLTYCSTSDTDGEVVADCVIQAIFAMGLMNTELAKESSKKANDTDQGIPTWTTSAFIAESFYLNQNDVYFKEFSRDYELTPKNIYQFLSNNLYNGYATFISYCAHNKSTSEARCHSMVTFKLNDILYFFEPATAGHWSNSISTNFRKLTLDRNERFDNIRFLMIKGGGKDEMLELNNDNPKINTGGKKKRLSRKRK